MQQDQLWEGGLLKKIKLPAGGSYKLEYRGEGNTRVLPQSKYVLSSVTMNLGLQTKIGDGQGNRKRIL